MKIFGNYNGCDQSVSITAKFVSLVPTKRF